MNNDLRILLHLTLIGLLMACHSHSHDEEHGHDHPPEEITAEAHEDEVILTPEQIDMVGLKFGKIEEKNLKSTLKVNGQLELPPQNQASVSPMASGRIQRILVQPGQFVSKGAVLAYIQNPDFIDWQQQYLESTALLTYLEKERDRQKDLVAKEIAPVKQLEKVESDLQMTTAKLVGITTKLNILGLGLPKNDDQALNSQIAIRSPISGYIRSIKVNMGLFVNPQMELFEIVDNHHLHIDLMVFEKDIPYLKQSRDILFSLQSRPKDLIKAKIFAIGKALDEKQRTVAVHAEIENIDAQLLPGMYVEGRIILENRMVPALPEEAIAVDKGLNYIFVREEQKTDAVHFKKVSVLTGTKDFGFVEVSPLEPIAEHQEIVTDGAYYLMAQSKKGETAGGHHH